MIPKIEGKAKVEPVGCDHCGCHLIIRDGDEAYCLMCSRPYDPEPIPAGIAARHYYNKEGVNNGRNN